MKHEIVKDYTDFRNRLAFFAEDEYREFVRKGIPCERPILGVRIPIVRSVVNMVPREMFDEFLKVSPVAVEEVLARGMVICKLSYEEMLGWFDSQIDYIDNWCTCDIFCSGLRKVILKHRAEFLDLKVKKLLSVKDEFAVRVGLVLLKTSYVDAEHLNLIFDRVESLATREEYYIRMAIAWLLSECFIKFPAATTGYLINSHLPKWTYNKTISKICDSYRVETEVKDVLRGMRK